MDGDRIKMEFVAKETVDRIINALNLIHIHVTAGIWDEFLHEVRTYILLTILVSDFKFFKRHVFSEKKLFKKSTTKILNKITDDLRSICFSVLFSFDVVVKIVYCITKFCLHTYIDPFQMLINFTNLSKFYNLPKKTKVGIL